MRKLALFLSVIFIGGLLMGYSKHQTSDSSSEKTAVQSSSQQISEIKSTDEFLQVMEEAGYKINSSNLSYEGELSGEITHIDILGDAVIIYEYENKLEMEKDAGRVSDDGTNITGKGTYEWKAPPHFYKNCDIIVLYLGDKKGIMEKIVKVMGKQFAGRRKIRNEG